MIMYMKKKMTSLKTCVYVKVIFPAYFTHNICYTRVWDSTVNFRIFSDNL